MLTYNVPDDGGDEVWNPRAWFGSSEWVVYLCGQYEKAPSTGQLHFQGYVHGRTAIGLQSLKKELGLTTVHLEVRRGTHAEARAYCTKEESRAPGQDPLELGDPPRQGSRSDLSACKQYLDSGGLAEVFEKDFSSGVRFYRGFEKYLNYTAKSRDPDEEPVCYYSWGAPGSGKTRAVYAYAAEHGLKVYPCPLQGRTIWFDGFRPGYHGLILLDDYYRNWDPTYFLRFTDRYPLQVPVKGGFVELPNVVIWVTSNYALEDQYPDYVNQEAFRRRFKQVYHYDEIGPRNKKQKT